MYRGIVLWIGVGAYRHQPADIELADRNHFGIPLFITFGIDGQDFTEDVGATVCSPSWLDASLHSDAVVRCGELIVMRKFDAITLSRALQNFAHSCVATTVKGVFAKLARIGHSEFEDFNQPAALRQFLDDGHAQCRIPVQRTSENGQVE